LVIFIITTPDWLFPALRWTVTVFPFVSKLSQGQGAPEELTGDTLYSSP